MRKLLHTTAALSALLVTSMAANAADVRARPAPYAPPPPVYAPPPFSWTGFYLGGNIGGAWAHRDVTDTFFLGDFGNGNNNGVFIGGGQVGYNWQVGYAVLGIEADFDGAANNNNTRTVGIVQVTSNNRWITTLAARFGLTNGPWLFYGKAGAGWVGNEDFTSPIGRRRCRRRRRIWSGPRSHISGIRRHRRYQQRRKRCCRVQ
jgi:outer membrane immunogenic protein